MATQIKEIICSLVESEMATLAYYDHSDEDTYYGPLQDSLKGYNPNNKDHEPVMKLFGHGDYVGSDVDMANMRFVEENFSELINNNHIIYNHGGYGFKELVVFITRLAVCRSGLYDTLEGLSDYIVLDDEYQSRIEDELLEEAWDLWAKSDFEKAIKKIADYDFEETDWIEDLFWTLISHDDGGNHFTEGTSMYVDIDKMISQHKPVPDIIIKNAELLNSGEFEIVADYVKTNKYRLKNHKLGGNVIVLADGTIKNGDTVAKDLLNELNSLNPPEQNDFIELHKEYISVYPIAELQWRLEPTNKALKTAARERLVMIKPLWLNDGCYCGNCKCKISVMTVHYGKTDYINVCPDCYNLLMDYLPRCLSCKKNIAVTGSQEDLWGNDSYTYTLCDSCARQII